jgi:hypothetical protein
MQSEHPLISLRLKKTACCAARSQETLLRDFRNVCPDVMTSGTLKRVQLMARPFVLNPE